MRYTLKLATILLSVTLASILSAQHFPSRTTVGAPPPETIIESDNLEMVSDEERNFFVFKDNVRVIGNNLLVTCDNLEVTALRKGEDKESTVGEIGSIQVIVATGNVEITQDGRKAFAGKAEVYPTAGRVILSENPRVVDDGVEVTGWRMTMVKDTRRVQVENDPNKPTERRPTVRLDALPDLGYDKEEQKGQPLTPEKR